MKKTIAIFSAIITLFSFSACSEKRSNISPLTKGITFTAELTYYNECYEGFVTVSDSGDMDIEITSPDTIKGLSFHFDKSGVTAKYLGLEYKYDTDALPEGIVCTNLYEIIRDTQREDAAVIADKDDYFILGNTGKINYKMFVGATGLPISAEDEKSGFKVGFKNVTVIPKN